MTCVTTARYSPQLNETILDAFAPSCELRQGDLLSPYIFVFVVDGLFALFESATNTGSASPVKICRRAPTISHLLFMDDTLFFIFYFF